MMEKIESGEDGVDFVLVFKLSRFGRNAADVLNSLQTMQDYGVNLICVEDGIDSSKDAGKLMISVLSAVAEIERENIRTQTMAGSEQKAKEGKWNGGFSSGFVKSVLDNPVYMGKIAYGRRRIEKKIGTRNEMHIVEQDEYPIYDGHHEAIISEADWQLAQEKRKANNFKREKLYSTFTEVEQRDFMRAFIERIDIVTKHRKLRSLKWRIRYAVFRYRQRKDL